MSFNGQFHSYSLFQDKQTNIGMKHSQSLDRNYADQ